MLFERILSDIEQVRRQIEADFSVDLKQNPIERAVLMRGENAFYPETESSMKRFLTAEDGRTMKPLHFISPFIDFEDIYAEFHSEQHGLSAEEGAGFLQHYGFPTDLFDLSPCFNTARFFASYGKPEESVSVIGVFETATLGQYFDIADLSRHPFALRPTRQLAFSARPACRIQNLKAPVCDECFKSVWYRFYKSPEDHGFANQYVAYVYPSENEIDFFFGKDLLEFVTQHFTFQQAADDQRKAVLEKVESIREQLRSKAEHFISNLPSLC